MALSIESQNHTAEDILQVLSAAFPELKPVIANKTTIVIQKNKIACVVRLRKNKIKIYGDINTKHILNIILIALGIVLGLISVILVFAILYIAYARSIKILKREVFTALSNS